MKVCPKCGSLAHFNSYFGEYICCDCNWRDDTYNRQRVKQFRQSLTPKLDNQYQNQHSIVKKQELVLI